MSKESSTLLSAEYFGLRQLQTEISHIPAVAYSMTNNTIMSMVTGYQTNLVYLVNANSISEFDTSCASHMYKQTLALLPGHKEHVCWHLYRWDHVYVD